MADVPALQFTELTASDQAFYTFDMPDRRPGAGSSHPTRWCFQMDIERILYGNWQNSTGALYRLLQRTPDAKGRALCLRHRSTSIGSGLCSKAEYEAMLRRLHTGTRSFTLVPADAVAAAVAVFGETEESAALLEALGYDRPTAWDEASEDEAEDEGEGEGEEGGGGEEGEDGEEGEEGGGDHSDDDGPASVADTEQFADEGAEFSNEDADASDAPAGQKDGGGGGGGVGGGDGSARAKKAARVVSYTLTDVPEALQRELAAFSEWRLKPINRDREGACVEPVTVVGNKADALRFLGWLKDEKGVRPSLGGVFGSDKLGTAVQLFIDHLVRCGRTYTTVAGYVKSFIAVARFVHAVKVSRAAAGAAVSTAPAGWPACARGASPRRARWRRPRAPRRCASTSTRPRRDSRRVARVGRRSWRWPRSSGSSCSTPRCSPGSPACRPTASA